MNVLIAPFSLDHYDRVYALWRQTEGIGVDDDADSRDGVSAYLSRNPGMSFVALDGSSVVGAVLCGHDGRRGYLHHLAVHPGYRRHGVGGRLVDHCLASLKEAGIRRCNLLVFADNDTGLAFWERTGWSLRQNLRMMSRNTDCD